MPGAACMREKDGCLPAHPAAPCGLGAREHDAAAPAAACAGKGRLAAPWVLRVWHGACRPRRGTPTRERVGHAMQRTCGWTEGQALPACRLPCAVMQLWGTQMSPLPHKKKMSAGHAVARHRDPARSQAGVSGRLGTAHDVLRSTSGWNAVADDSRTCTGRGVMAFPGPPPGPAHGTMQQTSGHQPCTAPVSLPRHAKFAMSHEIHKVGMAVQQRDTPRLVF